MVLDRSKNASNSERVHARLSSSRQHVFLETPEDNFAAGRFDVEMKLHWGGLLCDPCDKFGRFMKTY